MQLKTMMFNEVMVKIWAKHLTNNLQYFDMQKIKKTSKILVVSRGPKSTKIGSKIEVKYIWIVFVLYFYFISKGLKLLKGFTGGLRRGRLGRVVEAAAKWFCDEVLLTVGNADA